MGTRVSLTGSLVCADETEAALVRRLLPEHVRLTRVEPGCLSFDVTPTADPMVWRVAEVFADETAFRSHQHRVAASHWGRATAGIERRYVVSDSDDPDR